MDKGRVVSKGLKEWIIEDLDLRIWELECFIKSTTLWERNFSYERWYEIRPVMRQLSFTGTEDDPIWIRHPPRYRYEREKDEFIMPPKSTGKINMHITLTKKGKFKGNFDVE